MEEEADKTAGSQKDVKTQGTPQDLISLLSARQLHFHCPEIRIKAGKKTSLWSQSFKTYGCEVET